MKKLMSLFAFIAVVLSVFANDNDGTAGYSSGTAIGLVTFVILVVGGIFVFKMLKKE